MPKAGRVILCSSLESAPKATASLLELQLALSVRPAIERISFSMRLKMSRELSANEDELPSPLNGERD
jgi:hypothetical protein